MNVTIKASIAGVAFVFERNAYEILESYLNRIEAGYKYSPDGDEIIADIEARIAELLLSEQEADKVIGSALATKIVEQLGYPDDINMSSEEVRSMPRRLYRNPDGAKLGGVCSGVATYFGIDVVWLRVAVILGVIATPFFGGLTGILTLAYFILWLVVPMARTPRQRLEMTGAPITAERIERQFRAEANTAFSNATSQRSESVLARLVYILGKILIVFIKVVIGILFFAMIVAIIGVGIAIVAVASGEGYVPILDGLNISSDAYIIMILAAVITPLILLVLAFGAVLFNGKVHKAVSLPLAILWVILIVYLSVVSVDNRKALEQNWYIWEHSNDRSFDARYFDYQEGNVTDTLIDNNLTDSLTIIESNIDNNDGGYDAKYFDYQEDNTTDSLTIK